MDAVVRAAATYFVVWLILRISGKRSLAEITTFDFVLLLIISETTQAALTDKDNSMTGSFLLVITMIGIDRGISVWKQRSQLAEKWIDGTALIILENGVVFRDRMDKERVDEEDILQAARELRGLERLDQIKYAILERNGGITVVPKTRRAKRSPPPKRQTSSST